MFIGYLSDFCRIFVWYLSERTENLENLHLESYAWDGTLYLLTHFTASTRSASHSAAYEIPLFGSFCCRTAVQPYCAIKELQVGRVSIREKPRSNTNNNHVVGRHYSSSTDTGRYYFCTLINAFLYAYNIDRDRRLMEMAIRVDKVWA